MTIRLTTTFMFFSIFSAGIALVAEESVELAFEETSRFGAAKAVQASVATLEHVYAIDSRSIAKYDRRTRELLSESTGAAIHLNSGFIWRGKILCAHSNYPSLPEQSQVMALDPNTMKLSPWKDFGDYGGSLTWIVRRGNRWLCNFAKYGEVNSDTFLVEFDNGFNEIQRWNYPSEVISNLGKYSLSGGVWYRGQLLVTGHDEQETYVLEIPKDGILLKYVATVGIPFTGQGFAVDKRRHGLVGISRAERQIIFIQEIK